MKSPFAHINTESGFTLVESLVIILLVTIALFGYLTFKSELTRSKARMEKLDTSRAILSQMSSKMNSIVFDDLVKYCQNKGILNVQQSAGYCRTLAAGTLDDFSTNFETQYFLERNLDQAGFPNLNGVYCFQFEECSTKGGGSAVDLTMSVFYDSSETGRSGFTSPMQTVTLRKTRW